MPKGQVGSPGVMLLHLPKPFERGQKAATFGVLTANLGFPHSGPHQEAAQPREGTFLPSDWIPPGIKYNRTPAIVLDKQ